MQKITYKCGCIREIKNNGDLIHCCNNHEKLESQEDLENSLSEEFSEYSND